MDLVIPLLETERDACSGLLNIRDRNGDTALHIASRGGFKGIVKELLKANAKKELANNVSIPVINVIQNITKCTLFQDGKTAEEVATEAKHNKIAKLLRGKKSLWHFTRNSKKSPVPKDAACADSGRVMELEHGSRWSLDSNGSAQSDELLYTLSGNSDFEQNENITSEY